MSEPRAQMQAMPIPLAITSALVLVTVLVYLRGWFSLRNAFPNLIPGWRLAAFIGGLVSVWTVVGSPLARLDHQSLTIHMVKHLLLMTVAAPLILEGAPVFTFVCGLPKLFIKNHLPLASAPGRWMKPRLMHSTFCWLAGTATVIGWHLPVVFQLGMRFHWLHVIEDLSFLLAGLLFWWPIVQSTSGAKEAPPWSSALYLFLATLPCDTLSAFLVFCNRLVYPVYLSASPLFGMAPLRDQECAGALMWVWVTFAYVVPAVAITVRILSPSNTQLQSPIRGMANEAAERSPSDAEAEVL